MMDTLAVALRVAEEAVEEAISKAETYSDSLVTLKKKNVLIRTTLFLLIWVVAQNQVDREGNKLVVTISWHT